MPLTDAQIRRTKATVKPVRLYDGDGMYLVTQPQGGRSWRFDYRFQGARKGICLGTPGKGRPIEERHLRADLLLVHDPAVPGQIHRDVLAVDGHDLVGREKRLRQLFSTPAADVRALLLKIVEDSARHNLGHIERNINIPTFQMVALHPENQWRFAFRDRGIHPQKCLRG